jgi:uncharacterized protein YjbJ (UPF0337 family)
MPENFDDAKGQVKEKAGKLTGDENLEAEGKSDQLAGKVKGLVDDVVDIVEDVAHKVTRH